jgi:hypothetical protein
LLRFAYKIFKNRRLGDFLPYKLRKEPDNRGFYGFSKGKSDKNLQVQQAPSLAFELAAFFPFGGEMKELRFDLYFIGFVHGSFPVVR